ncbi:MAG TPA: hypothetical protein VGG32_01420 [Thermoplasmata archaeon]
MSTPDQSMGSGARPTPGRDAARNARHSYLVGRLQNRQITMEEASELFTIMQGMIQMSEAARLALMRAAPASHATAGHIAPPPRPPPPPGGSIDDLLLIGLLAMGAGAGLLAAMTKRIQDVTTPTGSAPSSNPNPGTSSRKG